MRTDSLVLVDAHSLLHRLYHAPGPNLTSSDGKPTKVVLGFVNKLNQLFNDSGIRTSHVVICFDPPRHTLVKRKVDPKYKDGRKGGNDDLYPQIDLCRDLCGWMGLSVLKVDGYEADDLIATLVGRFSHKMKSTVIVTTDKDLMQLIQPFPIVRMYDCFKQVFVDSEQVKAKWGVLPSKVVEVQTLCGDSTDNIPGVEGIGDKTAAKLVQQHGTAEKAQKASKPGSKLAKTDLNKFRKLVSLIIAPDCVGKLSEYRMPTQIMNGKVKQELAKLGFNKSLQRFNEKVKTKTN